MDETEFTKLMQLINLQRLTVSGPREVYISRLLLKFNVLLYCNNYRLGYGEMTWKNTIKYSKRRFLMM